MSKSFKKRGAMLIAVAMAIMLVISSINPAVAMAATDANTMDNYKTATGDTSSSSSTRNAGRVWSDKSVFGENTKVDGVNVNIENGEDFNIVYSAMSSSEQVKGKTASALDVIFILDTSGSMNDETSEGIKRINAAIDSLNSSLDTILNNNPNNRVGVATFATGSNILMPLNHYKHSSGNSKFISTSRYISNTRGTINAEWENGENSVSFAGGTNTQLGFNTGMKMLLDEKETTVTIDGKKVKRIPVVVILSDGASTYSINNNNWWSSTSKEEQGPGSSSYYGNGMLAMMAAAYNKQAVNRNYNTKDTRIYTIGFGISELEGSERNLAEITLNPSKHWKDNNTMANSIRETFEENENAYLKGKNISVEINRGESFTVKHPDPQNPENDITSLKYEDKYFDPKDAAGLEQAFKDIVSDITTSVPDYPTDVKDATDPTAGGYITYTDPIGEYMEVKDIKYIIHSGKKFNVTKESDGTYTATGDVTNPVTGEPVSISGIKMSIIEEVTEGQKLQTLKVEIPAALIPLRIYSVDLDVNGNVTGNKIINDATPIRVIYSVGKQEGVDQLNGVSPKYIDENSDINTGKVKFYSNRFTKGAEKGNAKTSFKPSPNNPNYYFQQNTIIYKTNKNGKLSDAVAAGEKFVSNQKYYLGTPYYNGNKIEYEIVQRTGDEMSTTPDFRLTEVDGKKALKAGVPRTFHISKDFELVKEANTTGTASHVYVGEIEDLDVDTINTLSFFLGNNGVVEVDAPKNLIVKKTVTSQEGTVAPSDVQFKFDITVASKQNRTVNAVVTGPAGETTREVIFDANGKTTVQLKDGESIAIPHVAGEYTVTEQRPPMGFTSRVKTDNASGTVGFREDVTVEFINNYAVEPIIINQTDFGFPMIKTLNNRTFEDTDNFNFQIEQNSGPSALPENRTATVKGSENLNQTVANADFGKFTFKLPGKYVYTISEVFGNESDIPGINYDTAKYRLTINIVDDNDGTLSKGAVTLEKQAKPGDAFVALNLADNVKISFTNEFNAESANAVITGKKVLENRGLSTYDFRFRLSAVTPGAPMPASVETVVDTTSGNITFGAIEFKTENIGNTYKYKVTEVQPTKDGTFEAAGIKDAKKVNGKWVYKGITFDNTVKEVSIAVTKDQAITVPTVTGNDFTFTNVYNSKGTFDLTGVAGGTKNIEGRTFKPGDEFRFDVTSPANGPKIATPVTINPSTGNSAAINFGTLNFDESHAGKSYTYIFREEQGRLGGITYDPAVKTITLSVKDNGDGTLAIEKTGDTLTWTNKYKSEFRDTINFDGIKQLNGKDLTSGMFTFDIRGLDNAPMTGVIATSNNNAEGFFNIFKDLRYTFEDMGGLTEKTFVYEVKEYIPEPGAKGMTYDPAVYHVAVTVTDDQEGRLSVGRDGIKITKQAKAGEAFKPADKVIFNNTYHPIDVPVIPFETDGTTMLKKQLTGERAETLKADEFTFSFELTSSEPADGVVITGSKSAKNSADGTISFAGQKLTFKEAGTYVFTITEDTRNLPEGVTSKVSEVEVTYRVRDDNGQLVATPYYSGNSNEGKFVNEYNSTGTFTFANLPVVKEISGRAWEADDAFTFTLAGGDPDTLKAIENESVKLRSTSVTIEDTTPGHQASFGDILFTKPGTYNFKVTENADNLPSGIKADSVERNVKISVTDNSDGTMTAELVEVQSSATDKNNLTFVNVFAPDETVLPGLGNLTVTKELKERPWLDTDEFKFTLSAGDEKTTAALGKDVILGTDAKATELTITNKSVNKSDNFSDITFKKPGTYVFNIAETAPEAANVTAKDGVKKIYVNVTLLDGGKLEAKVDAKSDKLNFTNEYVPDSKDLVGESDLVVTKSITNRNWLENESFTFELTAENEAAKNSKLVTMPADTTITVTGDTKTNHFGNITFKKAGQYVFNITEKLPEGTVNGANGLTYDLSPRRVVVDVKDNYDGTLTVTKNAKLSDALSFTNEYNPTPLPYDGKTNLKINKLIDGRKWAEGDSFTFTLDIDRSDADTVSALRANALTLPADSNGITISYKAGTAEDKYTGNFSDITFYKAGVYKFVMRENTVNVNGIKSDTEKKFTVTVTDDGRGRLTASANPVVKFTNKYTYDPVVFPAKGHADLQVTKEFTGRPGNEWKATDSFTFKLAPINDYEAGSYVLSSTECTIKGTDLNKAASFGSITFNKPGEYQFQITEVIPEGVDENNVKDGIKYNGSKKRITINVTDDGKGKLKAERDSGSSDPLIFTNTYTPSTIDVDPTNVTTGINLKKSITGRTWKDTDSFKFSIEALGGAPAPAKSNCIVNGPEAKFDFGNITFTAEDMKGSETKTFRYKVTEVVPEDKIPGVTYDTKSVTFAITIKDNGNGNLVQVGKAVNEADNTNAGEFVNEYTPEETKLDGATKLKVVKNFTGREDNAWLPTDEFKFQLVVEDPATNAAIQDGNVILPANAKGIKITAADPEKENAFGDITFKKTGTYKFSVVEVEQTLAGVTYAEGQTITVVVTDNTDAGKLVATVERGTELQPFNNIYQTGVIKLDGHENLNVVKEITGRKWIGTDEFTFTIAPVADYGDNVVMPAENEVTITIDDETVGHTKHFGDITFKHAGEYKFSVTEKAPEGVEPDVTGAVKVNGLTYDIAPQIITVTVTDEDNGKLSAVVDKKKLTFTNRYSHENVTLEGSANLIVQKSLTGREWMEDDLFEFKMLAGNEAARDVTVPANINVGYGSVNHKANFADITFENPGTYEFYIQEVEPAADKKIPGVTYNTTPQKIVVTVVDNLDGTMTATVDRKTTVVNNTYKAKEDVLSGRANLNVEKVLNNRPWQPGDVFGFTLTGADDLTKAAIGNTVILPTNADLISISYSDENKIKNFGNIIFKEAGIFKFNITEKTGSLPNITYVTEPEQITVTVTDNKATGELNAEVTSGTVSSDTSANKKVVFTNTYKPDSATLNGEANLKVKKTIDGREWKSGDTFNFTIAPAADYGNKVVMSNPKSIDIAFNEAGNHVSHFGDITFTEKGTYKFTITETVPEEAKRLGGIDYAEPETVTVEVTDDYKGKLHAAVKGQKTTEFVNKYSADPGVLSGRANLQVGKVFEGRDTWQTDDSFTFKLAGRNNVTNNAIKAKDIVLANDSVTISSADAGAFFGDITFKKAGSYVFEVSEVKPENAPSYIEYDTSEKMILVEVVDNQNGQLVASLSDTAVKSVFTNKYIPTPVVLDGKTNLEVTKVIDGRIWKAGDTFLFEMTAEDEQTKAAIKEKKIVVPSNFDEISITEEDSDKKANFGDITFKKAGTYKFRVSEKNVTIPAITRDKVDRIITVVVNDDNKGKLSITSVNVKADSLDEGTDKDNLKFTNKYSHSPAVLDGKTNLKVEKLLTGRENNKWSDSDSFTFNIAINDKHAATKAAFEAGNMVFNGDKEITIKKDTKNHTNNFGNITFKEKGEYQLVVTEKVPEVKNGITYDTEAKVVEVVVEDKLDGTMTATAKQKTVQFNNEYSAKNVDLNGADNLKVSKTFKGKNWTTNEKFTFTLEHVDENGRAVGPDERVAMTNMSITLGEEEDTKTTTGQGMSRETTVEKAFGDINFKAKGVYYFSISEQIPAETNGIVYDNHKAIIKVNVTDNGKGALEASAEATTSGSMNFTNTFTPDPVILGSEAYEALQAEKQLTGRQMTAEDIWNFTIRKADNMGDIPMPAGKHIVKNDVNGNITFGQIKYVKDGTYKYVIEEKQDKTYPGITNDNKPVNATVVITYNADTGILSPAVTYEKAGAAGNTFVNTYKGTPADPVNVFAGLNKTVTPKDGNTFTMKGDEFTFKLTPAQGNPAGDPVEGELTATNDANGNITFLENVVYATPSAKPYIYTVTEVIPEENDKIPGISVYDDEVYTITVKVDDHYDTGKLTTTVSIKNKAEETVTAMNFDNEYKPEETSAQFSGKKNLTAVNSDKTVVENDFTFKLEAAEGSPLPEDGITEVKNDASGNFKFGNIKYATPGTYEYVISEVNDGKTGYTYDTAKHNVKVVVSDNGGTLSAKVSGLDKLVFNNTYEPVPLTLEGDTALTVKKHLDGRTLKDKEFKFELLNDEVTIASENDADGNVVFEPVTFVKAGTYKYSIVEKNNSLGGVTYDETLYTVEVQVDDEDGKLVATSVTYYSEGEAVEDVQFNNSYKAAATSVKLGAAKTLKGRDLKADEFQFALLDKDGKELQVKKNNADGVITFDELAFDEVGESVFYVVEKAGNEKYMTYDNSKYMVTVKVSDNENGSLVPEVVVTKDGKEVKGMGFVNKFDKPAPPKPEPPKPTPKTGDESGLAGFGLAAGISAMLLAITRRKERDDA